MATRFTHELGFTSVTDLNPRAEAFKLAFQEHLKTINRALQFTAVYADTQWHKEKARKRNELLRSYGSALVRYLAQPALAYPLGEKVLQEAQALSAELSDFVRLSPVAPVSDVANLPADQV